VHVAQVSSLERVITSNTEKMKCKTVHNKLIFFLEKELPVAEMQAVQEHLNSCTACSLFAEDLKKTLSILESDKTPELNPFFYTRVKMRLEQTQNALRTRPVVVRVLQPVAFSIILVLGIYAGIKLGNTRPNSGNHLSVEQEMIPYWDALDAEPIENFLME
jgi:Putative zinc-finger